MPPSIEKTLARIKETVESGAFYEAQQMYKTSYHRCKARQQLMDAITILQEGSITQLAHGQSTCGVELGLLLVEAYMSASMPANADTVSRVLAIIRAFPLPTCTTADAVLGQAAASSSSAQGAASPVVDEYARLVTAAVKWANKSGAAISSSRIHSAFASYLWKSFGVEGIGRALLHFIRGEDAEEFATALHSCAERGPRAELDLWLLRALLQVLAAPNNGNRMAQLAYARALYDAFIAKNGSLETPTGHFAELMLLALEYLAVSARAHDMFLLVRERYTDGVLRRDDTLEPLLQRVEGTFFSVRRGGNAGGPLGDLFGNLFRTLTEAQ
ncbi:hypothetical protein Vretimale_14087 [Volvox reticuliferus]|uniref:Uncharacterized protein n=1 Tax=Volvox reticuliferus TaxID=1737510 RepID=A0A8J4GLE2_9CHLO|nr:hypothetical protein Vretifemale_16265 [Volvox reticuliferus]GIM10316.1 hypothetical protein Vretimale_14087 [Volvox reticuliferus]